MRDDVHTVSGLYTLVTRNRDLILLADCSVNIEPTAEDSAEIALCAASAARRFEVEPRVAMLSSSNFGSTKHPLCDKIRRATELVKKRDPSLMIDGELMADTAITPDLLKRGYPFSTLKGGAEAIGPVLMGMSKPVYVLPRGPDVEDIINIATIAAVDAQCAQAPASAGVSEKVLVPAD